MLRLEEERNAPPSQSWVLADEFVAVRSRACREAGRPRGFLNTSSALGLLLGSFDGAL